MIRGHIRFRELEETVFVFNELGLFHVKRVVDHPSERLEKIRDLSHRDLTLKLKPQSARTAAGVNLLPTIFDDASRFDAGQSE